MKTTALDDKQRNQDRVLFVAVLLTFFIVMPVVVLIV